MRVAVVTAGSPDYAELSAVTTPTKERYAERHGYDFAYFDTRKERGDMCKYDAYCEVYAKGYDFFFWIDLDAQIMNSAIAVESLLVPGAHFIWSYDHAGPNSGVYIARCSSEGKHFMDRSYATALENGWGDQTAMTMTALIDPFREWVACIPGKRLNCYDYTKFGWEGYQHKINCYEPGDLILHMPGYPNEVRVPELRRRLGEAT